MPLFLSDEEFSRLRHDVDSVAEKADSVIRDLRKELDTVRAQADASSITAEQTCSLLEQKYLSLSSDFSQLQSHNDQLQSSLDQRLSELAQVQAQKHQLHLQAIEKDGEIERLKTDVSELHKSKRQLLELVELKDSEISEKNANIKSYLDKIVNLTDIASEKEARVSESEAELARSQAACARLSQAERQLEECSTSLNWNKERARELETKLKSLEEELRSTKDAASANEEQLSAELSTVNKLVELYKESSEEWSKKAGDLQGVIKALETHLDQVQNDYKERLEKEVSARQQFEKEVADLKLKLEKCEAEIERSRKENELKLLPLSNFTTESWINSADTNDTAENDRMLVPRIPAGVSGTALAASLLRDGWSLAKMYSKYQEAVDALRHEQMGRKESEAVLQRILYELEEKAELILDERAEHERMAEAYSMINQKLQMSTSEQANLEKMIQELKADLRRHERDYNLAQKEIIDLQKQVTVLLKECQDIQIRCGSSGQDNDTSIVPFGMIIDSNAENVISERLLTFKDINGLVEQNVQLRSVVRSLSEQIENKEMEFKEKLEMELKKHTDEAAARVVAVLQRAEEQGQMIESLHTSVSMYKRLYEEEHKLHSALPLPVEAASEDRRPNFKLLLEGSQETTRKAQEQAAERVKRLEEELEKSRLHPYAQSVKSLLWKRRAESNGILARNVEFSQLIIDYQRKLRENSESVNAASELSRKLNMEVSVLKHEKEMLVNAEKRALDEVRSLSERVHRLQASLDTIQCAEQVREEARAAERKRQEEYTKQIQREWAEARKELQEERDNVRALTQEREQTIKSAMRQVEEMAKDLSNALHAAAAAETRATLAEVKLSDLEKKIKSSDVKDLDIDGANGSSSIFGSETITDLRAAKEEIEKLKEEAHVTKDHMLQYKSIAQVNEDALKQMECAHENFKVEAEKLKRSLEAELLSLREKVSELENECSLKSEEVASAAAGKEEDLSSASAEIRSLKEENSAKASQIMTMEIQISALKEDLDKEHQRWRACQDNYQRQVILQSETIQELNKTSQALGLLQEEASEMRRLVDAQKSENNDLKSKWEAEKAAALELKNDFEKKYNELNEQNKILHSRLEALHIQSAEKDRSSSGLSSGTAGPDALSDADLQKVVHYLRRTKEIAETEISLLKQEKLRLQSQLESALTAAETAQSSLHSERASSRTLLFSEEEIKSLQLQVREMNLLRESNVQLREENKHNFEECQKLREVAQKANVEIENMEKLLKESQIQVEACNKEILIQKLEKEQLEKRVAELLERCKNIDVEEYDRLKDEVQQMQEKLKEKDSQLEENKRLLSEKQGAVSLLEQDLCNCRSELSEREKRINDSLQAEASLKSEVEKQRKMISQLKRRLEILSKEKEELSKENQAITRQLEELKQAKKSGGDTSGDQAMKEEKDTRIQILEKHLERQREELKAEKARRLKNEKAVMDSYKNIEQEKAKFLDELEKHKQYSKRLSDELDKYKHGKESLPEGTSLAQQLPGSDLEERSSAYVSAVENYEKASRSVSSERGAHAVPSETAVADSTAVATTGLGTSLPAKSTEESERRSTALKSVESRKMGRKLVRPRLLKPEEPQGDTEMSETEVANKPVTSTETETQGNSSSVPVIQTNLRKRLSSSSDFGSREESTTQGESGSDVAVHLLKKPKGSEPLQERAEGQVSAVLESLETLPAIEEVSDVGDLPQAANEEAITDLEKEEEVAGEKVDEPKEPQIGETNQVDSQIDNSILEENLDGAAGKEMVSDDGALDNADLENQSSMMEIGGDREEGELLPDAAELEGSGDAVGSAELVEAQAQPEPASTPVASPARVDDEIQDASELTSQDIPSDEKNEEVDVPEETAEVSDKSNDGTDQAPVEGDQVAEAASVVSESTVTVPTSEASVSKQESPSVATESEEVKQVSPLSGGSTTINLSERARQRAMLRQAGAGVVSPSPSRGRGRGVPRGRGVRGRRGRGPTPSEQP
ncbi:hypothetical protein F8388_026769 [Cannabis sativa]|uniref:Nuclear-pore anchor n=1 Tax=Cannabis sativa TaxID=3483 RepID=A0A7J6H3C8_CANSA|nr:hypothetical protein F8388_026769 [Cannabis sativa]